jgi:hypothetical protein
MVTPERLHDRMKKRMNWILTQQREYAVMKLSRRLKNIALPPGFPEGSQAVLEELMESILETTNTSLMTYADALLTVMAEELAALQRPLPPPPADSPEPPSPPEGP